MLSVIIPSYNEADMIDITTARITRILQQAGIDYELIFVNDGSSDSTWEKICTQSQADKHVNGICFSKNFGKEAAIFAGLEYSCGECCVVIDCDLQHPPEKIVEMYRLWQSGYEVVEAVKSDRGKETPMHRLCAKCFYGIISNATKIDMSRASDFKLLDRKAVDELCKFKEKDSFFRALSSWIGFKCVQIEFDVKERVSGKSKWSTKSLIKYGLSSIASFSTAPMQIVTALGAIMLIVAVVLGVTALVQKFTGVALSGFTTVIMIELFIGSIVMISLGIIGYYISKIYEETKQRPKYIVSHTCGIKTDETDK